MQIPVDITFKNLAPTDALAGRVYQWVAKLERVYDRITRCEVLVEVPHRRHRQGRAFHIRARLTLPGGELVASHDPGADGAHDDVYVALRDTFLALRRQLEAHVRARLRRDVKGHARAAHARVTFVDAEGEWGWIEPNDGRQVYFHRNSVLGGIDHLHVGDEVRFTEEDGDEGPQASTVQPIGEHGRHELPSF